MEKIDILSLTLSELEKEIELLGEKKFRAKQIFQWLHVKKIRSFDEMSNISLELRTKLSVGFCLKSLNIARKLESCIDNTVKYLYKLSALLRGINCHVNLIPVNSVKERNYKSSRESAYRFQKYLTDLGMNATVRRTLGSDIDAACGQLRREAAEKSENKR